MRPSSAPTIWRLPQLHAEDAIALTRSWRFALACATSALTVGVCGAVVMLMSAMTTGAKLEGQSILQVCGWTFAALFPLQLVYGRIVSVALMARGLFNWPWVVTAYLVPVALFALLLTAFPRVPWSVITLRLLPFALAMGTTFWLLLRRTSQRTHT